MLESTKDAAAFGAFETLDGANGSDRHPFMLAGTTEGRPCQMRNFGFPLFALGSEVDDFTSQCTLDVAIGAIGAVCRRMAKDSGATA